jgi:hypothetical protein
VLECVDGELVDNRFGVGDSALLSSEDSLSLRGPVRSADGGLVGVVLTGGGVLVREVAVGLDSGDAAGRRVGFG